LFLRRQLALYVEPGVTPRRIDSVTRVALAFLSRFFHWRDALVVVRPETMIRWHRAGWKLLWRVKSRPGRPSIPLGVQTLIRRMAYENPSWGEERIANELFVKLGIQVSARTMNKYLPPRPTRRPRGDMRWSTFLRVHAQGIIACDFFLAVTVAFRQLYVFVVIEHHSRRLIHCNVTAHPTAAWTLRQLRESIGLKRFEFPGCACSLHSRWPSPRVFLGASGRSLSYCGGQPARGERRAASSLTPSPREICVSSSLATRQIVSTDYLDSMRAQTRTKTWSGKDTLVYTPKLLG
jgi:hypothetical protein